MSLNVIYQTFSGRQTEFEFEYIDRTLLRTIEHTNFFDNKKYEIIKDSPLVVFSNNNRNVEPAFNRYVEKLENHALLHLSNECLRHRGAHSYSKARLVLRCCAFDPNLPLSNVFTVPIGFPSGSRNLQGNYSLPDDRQYDWMFLGQMKSQRKDMLDALRSMERNRTHFTSGFYSADAIRGTELFDTYKNSIFIPCPKGNVIPESNRMMEGLEYGCIPVVVRLSKMDYFRYVYGDHPFIIGDTWKDCASQMKIFLTDKSRLRDKQREVMDWYHGFLQRLGDDVRSLLLNGPNTDLKSEQFEFQRAARSFDWSTRRKMVKAFKGKEG